MTNRAPGLQPTHSLTRWVTADSEFIRERVADYQALGDLTVDPLNAIEGVEVGRAGGTAYLFSYVGALGATDPEVAQALHRDAGAIVNPGFQSGPRGLSCFRICFAQDERVWEGAVDRMADVLTGLGTSRAGRSCRCPAGVGRGSTMRKPER